MQSHTLLFITVLAVLLAQSGTAESLRCYTCMQMDLPASGGQYCDHRFDSSDAVTEKCSGDNNVCFKKTYYENGRQHSSRGCELKSQQTQENCEDTVGAVSCRCQSDLCNGSEAINRSLPGVLLSFVLTFGYVTNM